MSDQSPLGTILAWIPHPEPSLTSEDLPDGWLPCNGSTITKGPWTGGKTPDLNSIGAFLRGGREENILEVEDDQVQNHQHEDPGHQHDCQATATASEHYHSIPYYHSSSAEGTEVDCDYNSHWSTKCKTHSKIKTYAKGLTVSADCLV